MCGITTTPTYVKVAAVGPPQTSKTPTKAPTKKPRRKPTKTPTPKPSFKPTSLPSAQPVNKPTYAPTKLPSVVGPAIPGLRAVPDLVPIRPILPPTVHIHP